MPNYNFRDKKTNKEHTVFLWLSELDAYIAANPNLDFIPPFAAATGDPWRMGRKKIDGGFSEVLGKMKRFYKGNTIDQ